MVTLGQADGKARIAKSGKGIYTEQQGEFQGGCWDIWGTRDVTSSQTHSW